ncbi:MAG TPA: hypothetical protein VFD70_05660 [Anaerolineae bacterium]|nr:hypothetical protein [Anaerolineae bacterium]
MTDPRIDLRAADLGISITETPNAKFRIVKVDYQDEVQAKGQHTIWFTVLNEQGKPLVGQQVWQDWIGRNPAEDPPAKAHTNLEGRCDIPMFHILHLDKKDGPYFAFAGRSDGSNSDHVNGMGLPENHHVNFLLTFQRVAQSPPPPPTKSAHLSISVDGAAPEVGSKVVIEVMNE